MSMSVGFGGSACSSACTYSCFSSSPVVLTPRRANSALSSPMVRLSTSGVPSEEVWPPARVSQAPLVLVVGRGVAHASHAVEEGGLMRVHAVHTHSCGSSSVGGADGRDDDD